MMRAAGKYRAARFDIQDGPADFKGSNYMDLNSRSGFAILDSIQYLVQSLSVVLQAASIQ